MIQFPEHIDRITTLAEVAELRQRVISHNLANANTPNYQRLEVSFDEEVFETRKRQGKPDVRDAVAVRPQALATRTDGNSVDLDVEMGHLNENLMLFQLYSQVLASHLDTMRLAMQS